MRPGAGRTRAAGGQGRSSHSPAASPPPQENEKSPSQNRKAKDATSDNGKGQESGPARPQLGTPPLSPDPTSLSLVPTDGLAYSALLKNELLGAGIERVQDPQTEDRRLQPSTPEKKGLFTVSPQARGRAARTVSRPWGRCPLRADGAVASARLPRVVGEHRAVSERAWPRFLERRLGAGGPTGQERQASTGRHCPEDTSGQGLVCLCVRGTQAWALASPTSCRGPSASGLRV